jgi:hypothetical protein
MSYDLQECCPKCKRTECIGDCGLYTREEKEEFIKNRYFNDSVDALGRLKVPVVQLEKNPLPKIKIGSYNFKSKKK